MLSEIAPKLRRAIALPQATAMVVGTIIGASIFVQPSEVTRYVPSVGGVFLVWLISGLLTFFGALVCAELASMFTRSGGVYLYLKEAYSPSFGFLWGWAMFWSMHSGIIAAISVIFARYTGYFVPLGATGSKATAIAVIILLSAINYVGVRQGSTLQALITYAKVIAILLIIGVGFGLGSRVPEHYVAGSFAGEPVTPHHFFLALVAGLFAFGGFHMVTYNSEETIEPRRTIPRALMLGTLVVTVCYIALNAVYMYILPLDVVASSKRIAADAADALLGFGGGAFLSGLVIFSTFGALSGIVLAGPRVYYAMSQDGLLFEWIGKIHPRFRTPHRAIAVQMVWSSILVATGTWRTLFTRVIFTEWIFFGFMAIGLFILRRRPHLVGNYRMRGNRLIPWVFIVASFVIVANQLIADPLESVIGISFIVVGLPAYYLWIHLRAERKTSHDGL